MKRKLLVTLMAMILAAFFVGVPLFILASGEEEKATVTFFWAEYDGLTDEYRQALQDAFNASQEEMEVEIVPIDWDFMYDKITTAIPVERHQSSALSARGGFWSSWRLTPSSR
jgi:ABC-type glycerol-3-phosphate transport system substrate-binding protein